MRGAAPRPSTVQGIANILLAACGSSPPHTVGKNWATSFTKRRPELCTRFSRRYDYRRAQNEAQRALCDWVHTVQRVNADYGILPDDIYNFDETGFAMGLISTHKVVTRAEYYGRRAVSQPGNREWVTSIESINASGWSLPPCVIFQGRELY